MKPPAGHGRVGLATRPETFARASVLMHRNATANSLARYRSECTVEDVLARRTRISIEAWDRGVSAAPVAAALMGRELGWDDARIQREVETYLQRVAAERASQLEPDDESADRVRLEAPDIVVAP